MTDTTRQFKKQLPRNALFQVVAFLTQVGIGIWLVPYLMKHLGVAAYGLIPIAGMLTEYVSLISHNIAHAVTRFLTIALQKDDATEANAIFSTAFFSYLFLALLKIPLFALLISYANSIIHIPQELYTDAAILLTCSAGVFLVNLVASVFGVPMYAKNRLDISRTIDITRHVMRAAGVVVLFVMFGPALRFVGYSYLATSLTLLLAQVMIAKRLAPTLKLKLSNFEWPRVRQLTGMGGWLMVKGIGGLLLLRTDVWVCNRFIGPEAAGEYAALQHWPHLIRHGGSILALVVAPMVTIYYARSEMKELVRLSKFAVKILSLVLAIPIAVMCVFSSSLLKLWLGDSFVHLAPLMVIMVCHLTINVGAMPLFNLRVALNKVKLPAIVSVFAGVANLALAILLARTMGLYGIAIAGAIILTLANAVWNPVYAAHILSQPLHSFFSPMFAGIGLLLVLTAAGSAMRLVLDPASLWQLAIMAAAVAVTGIVAAWFLLEKHERRVISGFVPDALTPRHVLDERG